MLTKQAIDRLEELVSHAYADYPSICAEQDQWHRAKRVMDAAREVFKAAPDLIAAARRAEALEQVIENLVGEGATCRAANTPEWIEFWCEKLNDAIAAIERPNVATYNKRDDLIQILPKPEPAALGPLGGGA